jgi:hypothetical protein
MFRAMSLPADVMAEVEHCSISSVTPAGSYIGEQYQML